MRELNITLDRGSFNLIWKSLHARENELLHIIKEHGEDSDKGADALNDTAYLRLYKIGLKKAAEKTFNANAFIVENDEPFET